MDYEMILNELKKWINEGILSANNSIHLSSNNLETLRLKEKSNVLIMVKQKINELEEIFS